jgi:SagB-type dehydrogenase family enzyme
LQAELSAILAAAATPADSFVQLYLYVHRVKGLPPGVYRYWQKSGELERMRLGDQRVMAAGLSLGQDLAGNACVALSMVADLDRATGQHGDRGYRYAHFEAGTIGQRLYVAAEALGLQGTGIGAFFDDEVNRYLDLPAEKGQVIYHFAIGHAVPDTRLQA